MSVSKAQSVNSDQDINDGMAEVELQKLQRQYRIMEGDRKAYSEESRLMISKQRSHIEKLRKENEYLSADLKLVEQRIQFIQKCGMRSKRAETLAEEAEYFQKKIKITMQEIRRLDKEIERLDREIYKQRSEMGGVHAPAQNNQAIQKQICVLENRLDKALIKFNNALANNRKLRDMIDNLRRERLVFDTIYRKFEKELADQKKQMAEVIEMSNSAYEARDEAQTKVISLKEKSEKENQAYNQEIKELDRILAQDKRLKAFMATKTFDRLDSSGTEDGRPSHDLQKGFTGSQDLAKENLSEYEKAFTLIKEVTGIDDINELVHQFKQVEDQSFSLFNYVNEVNDELEKMRKEIAEINKGMDTLKEESIQLDDERKKKTKELETRLIGTQEKTEANRKQHHDTSVVLEGVRWGVEQILEKLSLPTTPQQPLRSSLPSIAGSEGSTEGSGSRDIAGAEGGGGGGVTDSNLLHFLGQIEQKTNDLLTLYLLLNAPRKSAGQQQPPTTGLESAVVATGQAAVTAAASAAGGQGVPPTGPASGVPGAVPGGAPGELDGGAPGALWGTAAATTMAVTASATGSLVGHGPSPPIGSITIIAPSTGDDYDSDDNASEEDDRPLTREELVYKTLRGLSKREKQSSVNTKSHKSKRRNAKKKPVAMNNNTGPTNGDGTV